jgi:small subunit ribosomal protein S21
VVGPAAAAVFATGTWCVATSNTMRGEMIELILDETDRIDWALKTFKRKVQKSGILRDLRRRRHYVKPSEARQLKSKAAKRRRPGR